MAAADAAPQTAAAPAVKSACAKRRVTYTSFEANTWQATFQQSGVTVLVDPWLVGELTFGNQSWIYSGEKMRTRDVDWQAVARESDLILITQGLDDHCHMPTLEKLPRDIPVVAQPDAAQKCRQLGYKNVTELDHGQTLTVADGKLSLTGTEGALVGPPWSKRQLGVVFRETAADGIALYYEPHADFTAESVQTELLPGDVDIVVTPVVNQELIAYPLVCGDDNAVRLLQQIKPSVVVPFMNAEMQASGPLSWLIKQKGSLPDFERKLRSAGLADVRVQQLAPPPTPMTIEV